MSYVQKLVMPGENIGSSVPATQKNKSCSLTLTNLPSEICLLVITTRAPELQKLPEASVKQVVMVENPFPLVDLSQTW